MIHRFRIDNFLSIREPVELNFRIPGTTPKLPRFKESRSHPYTRLPSVVALVGPNGSGKTAVLRAMMETVRFAASSFDPHRSLAGIPGFIPFLSPETKAAPTRVEVEFDLHWPISVSGRQEGAPLLTRYSLVLTRERNDDNGLWPVSVDHEVVHTFPKGRPKRMMERRRNEPVYLCKEFGIKPSDGRLSAVPQNASAISTLAAMNVNPFPDIVQDILNVQTNIIGAEVRQPETDAVVRHYLENKYLIDEVSDKLQRFDLGIRSVQLHQSPQRQWSMIFEHEGLDTPVMLGNESSGTRHLVHIFPQLYFVLQTGHVAIMDAIDTELHAELTAEILRWFQNEQANLERAQLICSLHNLPVLDDLEKEEVFVVEKDRTGATRVQRARDYLGIRRDSSLENLYRSGAIGGMPVFG